MYLHFSELSTTLCHRHLGVQQLERDWSLLQEMGTFKRQKLSWNIILRSPGIPPLGSRILPSIIQLLKVHHEIVSLLLESGVDIDLRNFRGQVWKGSFLDRLSGIELNLEGVKFRMTVEVPASDDFERVKRLWEDYYGSQFLDSRRGVARRPDMIVVQGVPLRWFAKPKVSSKPSMLNTHTIFSVL